MDSNDYPQYTYQHSTTGVIFKVSGIEAKKASRVYIEEMVVAIGLNFPEGDWEVIGVKTYEEEW